MHKVCMYTQLNETEVSLVMFWFILNDYLQFLLKWVRWLTLTAQTQSMILSGFYHPEKKNK